MAGRFGAGPNQSSWNLINYVNDKLVIRMTPDKGRGVFATKDILPGEVIVVEKPIACHERRYKLEKFGEESLADACHEKGID